MMLAGVNGRGGHFFVSWLHGDALCSLSEDVASMIVGIEPYTAEMKLPPSGDEVIVVAFLPDDEEVHEVLLPELVLAELRHGSVGGESGAPLSDSDAVHRSGYVLAQVLRKQPRSNIREDMV